MSTVNPGKIASFDIEICDELTGSFDLMNPPHIACAAFALSDCPDDVSFFTSGPERSDMTPDQVTDMVLYMSHLVRTGYTFFTWNGLAFDFQVVAAWAGNAAPSVLNMAWEHHIDGMLLVTFQKGYYLGLDAALKGAGLESKLHTVRLKDGAEITDMSGAKAPELWKAGERQAVLDYLKVDVQGPLKLVDVIFKNKAIRWISKRGIPQAVRADLLTVAEAYEKLPKPADVSWLTNPVLREDLHDRCIVKPLARCL